MSVRRSKSSIRKSFLEPEDHMPVNRDLRFWLIHALHWHAFLFAVIAVLVVGMTMFNKADANVYLMQQGSY